MARDKGNKYAWNKQMPVSDLNCNQSTAAGSSKYKFVRRPVLSQEALRTAKSVPLPSRKTVRPVNSIATPYISGKQVLTKKNTPTPHFSRFTFIKVPESSAESRHVRSPRAYKTIHKLARRTVYKYVARGYHDVGITRKSRMEVGFSSTIISPSRRRSRTFMQTNENRYRYIRRKFNDSTRTNVSVIAHPNVGNMLFGRKVSPIQSIAPKSQMKLLSFHRAPVCNTYILTGMCDAGSDCSSVHDDNYIRICPRYLHHRCPLGRFLCPLAHVLDPCRLPICEFYEKSGCNRVNCPYLHTNCSPETPICPDFQKGRCPRGRTCSKRHIWLTKKIRKPDVSKGRNKSTLSPSVPGVATAALDPLDTVLSETQAPLFMSLLPIITPVPTGSLRNVFPPLDFIPLMNDEGADD